jgi:nitric oxide reductase activation protein
MATQETTKKRKLQESDAATDVALRKKQKRQQKKKQLRQKYAQEEADLDLEAGLNRAFERMDGQLLADHLAQKTRRFGTDLSPVELADLYISGVFFFLPNRRMYNEREEPLNRLTRRHSKCHQGYDIMGPAAVVGELAGIPREIRPPQREVG